MPSEVPAAHGALERRVLFLACLAQFMVVLDVSVVNVALPAIRADLHFTGAGLQWVVNGYVLTFAGFLLLGGRAADLFGRRRTFLVGLALFSAASLVGGLAQGSTMLIAARAAQGIGGAVLSPATLTILTTTFSEGERRARALGTWSAVAGGAGAAGGVVGGLLTTYLSWRWTLIINVPIGAVGLVGARLFLPESRQEGAAPGLDLAGAITVTGGLMALVYAIVGTDHHGWGSARTLETLGAAAALLALFFVIELRVAREPLVPLRLFRSRSISGANLIMFLIGFAYFAMWYFVSLHLQNVLGYTPLRAGLAFLPQALTIVLAAKSSARLGQRAGIWSVIAFGTGLTTLGFLGLARLTPESAWFPYVVGPGVLITFGMGLAFPMLAQGATAGVARTEAGLASGLLNTSRQVGGSIGLAALAAIATNHTRALALTHTPVPAALTAGFTRAFLVSAGFLVAAGLVALAVPALVRRAPPAA